MALYPLARNTWFHRSLHPLSYFDGGKSWNEQRCDRSPKIWSPIQFTIILQMIGDQVFRSRSFLTSFKSEKWSNYPYFEAKPLVIYTTPGGWGQNCDWLYVDLFKGDWRSQSKIILARILWIGRYCIADPPQPCWRRDTSLRNLGTCAESRNLLSFCLLFGYPSSADVINGRPLT